MEHKTCTKCGEAKPATTDFFYKSKGGITNPCKDCVRSRATNWNKTNKERRQEITHKYDTSEKGRETSRRKAKAFYYRHHEEVLEKARISNSERHNRLYSTDEEYRRKHIERTVQYAKDNPEWRKERTTAWRKKHPERAKEVARRSQRKQKLLHPERVKAAKIVYRHSARAATPKWLTKEQRAQMRAIKREAQHLTKETGVKHHVDHIIPIVHPEICGLHVPWNLQILTADENLSKNNRFEPGDAFVSAARLSE